LINSTINPNMLYKGHIDSQVSLKEMDDDVLVTVAKAGEALAFVELRRRHSDKIGRSVYRIVRNWEDSEDVLQDSFLKAYIHLKRFEGRSSFSSWLTRIAINSALMMLRKKRYRSELSLNTGSEDYETARAFDPPDLSECPEVQYERQERAVLLERAILRLPRGRQDVVDLHTQGCSTKEIARSLGISTAAVKSRLSRAKIALHRSPALKDVYTRRLRA
jgi:RNA polymerase sigma-70 factor (ECF subfamily)